MANAIFAHRGWSGKAPENTLAAFRLALEAPYVSGLELDVQLSSDGVPVVIHDFTLQRTTDGSGPVRAYTFRQLRALDAGAWFGDGQYRGERIPALSEVLELAKGKAAVNIELKTAGEMYPGIAEAAIRAVREAGMTADVFFTSFDHMAMLEAKSVDPNVRTGLLVAGRPILVSSLFRATGAEVLAIAHAYLTKELAEETRKIGVNLLAWTLDDPDDIARTAAMAPDAVICTNVPDRAHAALSALQ